MRQFTALLCSVCVLRTTQLSLFYLKGKKWHHRRKVLRIVTQLVALQNVAKVVFNLYNPLQTNVMKYGGIHVALFNLQYVKIKMGICYGVLTA